MTQNHPFRLIVFDVDGTLVDSQSGIVTAMTRAFEAEALEAPGAEAIRRIVGLSLDEAVARLLPSAVSAALVERVAEGYRQSFIALRSRGDYREPLYPGARETVAALNVDEVCLGIATGKNLRGLRVTLERHDLAPHFVTLQTADGGPGKPHPRMLLDAMAEVGAAPEETVFIGDTVFDMEMAANARTAALGVDWGYHGGEELLASGARAVVERFDALPDALAKLGEAGS